MSRRNSGSAESAAAAASEAARVLQQRGQESRAERSAEPRSEPSPEPKAEPRAPEVQADPDRIDRLRKNRPHTRGMEEVVARDLDRRGIKDEPEVPEKKAEPEAKDPAPKAAEPTPEAPVPAAEPVAAAEPAAEAPVAAPAPKTVRVKVDGEEFDAPQEEVDAYGGVRPYQIAMAQERRLRKTNDGLAEIKRMLAEGGSRSAQPSAPQQTDQQFIESKMDIVRFGTPAESAAAWLEIQQRTQPKALDAHTIIEQATSKIRHDDAVGKFDREFSDVVTNPILLEAVISIRNKRLAQLPKGQPVDWDNFYRTIGNQVRSAVPARQSQPAAAPQAATSGTPSQATSEREVRKASIVNLPTASARAELPKEDKQLSPDEARKEAILAMKKSRGIPTG